ncbi:MAG TPA: hypothetical protein VFC22_00270 [Solirubrobacteraceae bacterium]|nr:hypothetical protein [Solirubrobacteraceae bacterium]
MEGAPSPRSTLVELLQARERQYRGGSRRRRAHAPLVRRLLRALALG